MKKRSIILLSGLLAISAAGMATASAFIIKDAASVSASGTVDSVLVLGWGENKVSNITGLTPDNMIYREVQLAAPVASTGQSAYFHAALAAKDEHSIAGLKVEIATTTWAATVSPNPIATLGGDTLAYHATITDATNYFVRVSIDPAEYDKYVANTDGQTPFGGTLSFNYNNEEGGAQ